MLEGIGHTRARGVEGILGAMLLTLALNKSILALVNSCTVLVLEWHRVGHVQ